MDPKQQRLKNIKSTLFSRGLALAKVSVSASAKAAGHAMGNWFADESEKPDRFKAMLISQVDGLARELGQLKGSLMKVGQLLSMYGEHFLPPEANALLKSLQNQSPPLEWKAIEKVIRKQLSPEILSTIEIDSEPMACASLGQVHRVTRRSDGRQFAMKIQYPGVDKAIEGDLRALRSLLSVAKLIPKGPKYDELFKEVRWMLHQEVDYVRERELTDEFRNALKGDPRFCVPETISELSTRRILTTSLEEGIPVDSPEVRELSQERRNALGRSFLELYFKELFELGQMQTDPHFGNYRVRLGKDGSPDQLILLDFGAVRKFPKSFLDPYLEMVRATLMRDRERLFQAGRKLGFIQEGDSEGLLALFEEVCWLFGEPFFTPSISGVSAELYNAGGAYCWGKSDLPKRVAKKGAQYALAAKLRTPPREILFIDRKAGGLFTFLSVLKVECSLDPAFFEKLGCLRS